MNSGIIYKITNLINGKIYIGQTTTDLERRWRSHCSKHIGIKKNGKRFTTRIKVNYKEINLGYFDTEEDAALIYDHNLRKYFINIEHKLNFPDIILTDEQAYEIVLRNRKR